MLALCRHLRDKHSLIVVTNDIFTKEDGEFLAKHEALNPVTRIRAVETGVSFSSFERAAHASRSEHDF